jgi:hypothetical protein
MFYDVDAVAVRVAQKAHYILGIFNGKFALLSM